MSMKNSLLVSTLFAISYVVTAQTAPQPDWVLVTSSEDISISVDKASLKRSGDIVTVWESYVDKKGKKSSRVLSEYNCKTNQTKGLSASIYPSLDFTGQPISYPSQKEWSYVVRESFGESSLNYACKNAPKGMMDFLK